jgi:hypothetical protein
MVRAAKYLADCGELIYFSGAITKSSLIFFIIFAQLIDFAFARQKDNVFVTQLEIHNFLSVAARHSSKSLIDFLTDRPH